MPHNHEPKCCCIPPAVDPWGPRTNCPSCVEHGDLATLGRCPEESPSTGLRCLREAGHNGGHNTTDDQPWPGECTSCHATAGQPHTDYCQTPDLTSQYVRSAREAVDLVGHLNAAIDRARNYCTACGGHGHHNRDCPAQTSQPTATTSQPPTHTT